LASFAWLAAVVVPIILGTLAGGQWPAGESKPNLALTAEAIVSSNQEGWPGANAIDGKPATEWAGLGPHPWIKLQWKQFVTGTPLESEENRRVSIWEISCVGNCDGVNAQKHGRYSRTREYPSWQTRLEPVPTVPTTAEAIRTASEGPAPHGFAGP
jgi:hypothetical protein